MPQFQRRMGRTGSRAGPSKVHVRVRLHRRAKTIGLLALALGLALAAQVAWGRDLEQSGSQPTASAVPYHDGPVDSVPVRAPERPAHADELLALSVLIAILYGLRVSDLGRAGRSR